MVSSPLDRLPRVICVGHMGSPATGRVASEDVSAGPRENAALRWLPGGVDIRPAGKGAEESGYRLRSPRRGRPVSDRFRIERPDAFRGLLRLAAGQIGDVVDYSEWARVLGIAKSATTEYAALCQGGCRNTRPPLRMGAAPNVHPPLPPLWRSPWPTRQTPRPSRRFRARRSRGCTSLRRRAAAPRSDRAWWPSRCSCTGAPRRGEARQMPPLGR